MIDEESGTSSSLKLDPPPPIQVKLVARPRFWWRLDLDFEMFQLLSKEADLPSDLRVVSELTSFRTGLN